MTHKKPSLRAKRSNPVYWTFLWIAASLSLLAMTTPAQAEEYEYSPDHCQFTVTFPEEPYTSRRCEKSGENRCYDLVSYTQVYEVAATINFRVICNPITEGVFDQYNEEIMKATVRAMSKKNKVKDYNSSFREQPAFKQAGLVGEGQSRNDIMIYIAQLWIGETSAFTLEAELIGEAHEVADQLFADILRSVSFKTADKIEDQAEPATEEDTPEASEASE